MDKHAVFSTDHWPLRFAYGGHLDMGNCKSFGMLMLILILILKCLVIRSHIHQGVPEPKNHRLPGRLSYVICLAPPLASVR